MSNLRVVNLLNDINQNYKKEILDIIKKENPDSILANLSEFIIYKYFDIAIKSKKIHFFVLSFNNSLLVIILKQAKISY